MKRILTIQDISCVGKCSLTVALPVISACGIECSVLPTAVLSAHTAFQSFTFKDLTEEIPKILSDWKDQNITFDALYTGYLGSIKQLDIISKFCSDFKKDDNFIIIDPVMADNGEMYSGFNQNFADEMAKLCSKADIIVPNLTETSFLLHKPYIEKNYSEEYIQKILLELTDTGCKTAILTGVSFDDKYLGAYGYDKTTDKYFYHFNKRISSVFHGTGDVFASALCGLMAKGLSVQDALSFAVDFTYKSIVSTIKDKNHNWYGVNFEEALPYLSSKAMKV